MNRLKLGIAGCILTAIGLAATLLWFVDQEEAVDTISGGQVNLMITESELSGEYEGNLLEGLLPGQAVDKSPVIQLGENSEDAYIRVKLEYGGALLGQEGEAAIEKEARLQKIQELEAGTDFSEGWLKGKDGFYYYQEEVHPGSSIPFFVQVTIPETWGNEIAEQAFSIDLSAEGIPADYFDPWSEDENGNPVITGWYYTDGTPVVPGD